MRVFGLWRHRKGGLYFALGRFKHTETGEVFVAYLGRSGAHIRPAAMFLDGRFKRLV